MVERKAFRRAHMTLTEGLKLENTYIFLVRALQHSTVRYQYIYSTKSTRPNLLPNDGFRIVCLTLMMPLGGK